MINILTIIFAMSALLSCSAHTKHDHIKEKQIGEYYEYDIEGTRKEKIRREIFYHSKQVITFPFKAVGKGVRKTKSGISQAIRQIELILSDSQTVSGERRQLRKDLGDIEGYFESYYARDLDQKSGTCIMSPVKPLWRAIKKFLYTIGFRLPRATKRQIKKIVYGSCVCFDM